MREVVLNVHNDADYDELLRILEQLQSIIIVRLTNKGTESE